MPLIKKREVMIKWIMKSQNLKMNLERESIIKKCNKYWGKYYRGNYSKFEKRFYKLFQSCTKIC